MGRSDDGETDRRRAAGFLLTRSAFVALLDVPGGDQ
jgi:hypothetical protein